MKARVFLTVLAPIMALPVAASAGTTFDGTYVGPQGGAAASCRGNGINIVLIVENGLLRNKFDGGNHTIAVDDTGHFGELRYPLNDKFNTTAALKAGQIVNGTITGEIDYIGTISCFYKFTATKAPR